MEGVVDVVSGACYAGGVGGEKHVAAAQAVGEAEEAGDTLEVLDG